MQWGSEESFYQDTIISGSRQSRDARLVDVFCDGAIWLRRYSPEEVKKLEADTGTSIFLAILFIIGRGIVYQAQQKYVQLARHPDRATLHRMKYTLQPKPWVPRRERETSSETCF
jgi:hypothetical protein